MRLILNILRYTNILRGTLRWRHNDHAGVSNHQPHGCLLNHLFRRRSNKTSKLRVTGLCAGNSPGPVNSPHEGPVTRKVFPFDDVIMKRGHHQGQYFTAHYKRSAPNRPSRLVNLLITWWRHIKLHLQTTLKCRIWWCKECNKIQKSCFNVNVHLAYQIEPNFTTSKLFDYHFQSI